MLSQTLKGEIVGLVLPISLVLSGCAVEQTGEIRGAVTTAIDSVHVPLSGLTVALFKGTELVSETLADGEYAFEGLGAGSYRLEATTKEGERDEIYADVSSGLTTTVHFFRDPKEPSKGLFAFKPGLAVTPETADPDVTDDGLVNLEDLVQVRACIGQDPQECEGDVNGDGRIDEGDESLVKESFERNVLRISGMFGFSVSEGGSVATLAEGIVRIVSDSGGLTELRLEPTSDPTRVSIRVISDRGTASSEAWGNVMFAEKPDRPSTGILDLETGRLVAGELTLRISGEAFGSPIDIVAPVALGQVVFAPHGFRLYHTYISGVLTEEFPLFGGQVFVLKKCEEPKKDKACDDVVAALGDPICPLGGVKCVSPGAACALAGSQATCRTIVVGRGASRQCRRCACL